MEAGQTERGMDEKGEKRWCRGEKVYMTIRDARRVTGCELTLHLGLKSKMHHGGECLSHFIKC